MSDNDLILYTTEDGKAQFVMRKFGGQIWLTQLEIAELYQTTKQNISLHVKNIFSEGELTREATVKDYLTVQSEGRRDVQRQIAHYSLLITHYSLLITHYSLLITTDYRCRLKNH